MQGLATISNQIMVILSTTEPSMLVISFLIMVGAGLLTPSPSALGTSVFGALIVLVLTYFAQGLGAGHSVAAVASGNWDKFAGMQSSMLLGYVLLFAIPITIVHLVRKYVLLR